MNEQKNEWDLTVFTHCLLGILVFFFHTPSGIPILFQLLTKLGWRQEIEWFPANDLSARGNETRIRSKNPLGKLGFHIEVKACIKSHSLKVALIKPMALCTGLLWMNEIMVCISFPHTRHAIWLFFCLPFLPYIVKQNNAWLHFK